MPTVLSRTTFVSSTFDTSGDVYQRSVHGSDPLYPEIALAERVMASAGKIIWNGDDSHGVAGIVLDDFPTFDGSEGSIEVPYTPNADVLAGGSDELFYVPLIIVRNTAGVRVLVFEMYEDSGSLRYNLRKRNFGAATYTDIDTAAPTFTAGVTYRFRMEWKCGTPSGGPPFTSVAADGYVRWYLDDVLIGELTSHGVYIDASNANEVTTVLLATDVITGGSGLFGAIGGWDFFSGAPVQPIEHTTIFGDSITVRSSRIVAMNLDGETRDIEEEGTCFIGGDLIVTGTVTLTGDVVAESPATLFNSIVTTGSEIILDSSGNVVYVNGS